MIRAKRKCAILVMVLLLCLPLPSAATELDDMFSVMFRMMLVMMNVMSDTMLDHSYDNDFGFNGSFDSGFDSWPATNGFNSLYPISGVSSFPGLSPWSGMGGVPGVSPWSGMGGVPGMSPWSGMGGIPGTGMGMSPWSYPMPGNTWSNPFSSGYPLYHNAPYNPAGYGAWPGSPQWGTKTAPVSLLEGRWFGGSGEIFEVRGNRFSLKQGKYGITGTIKIENDIVNLYSPQTATVTQYDFVRNQSNLILQDATGQLLTFSKRPHTGAVHIF